MLSNLIHIYYIKSNYNYRKSIIFNFLHKYSLKDENSSVRKTTLMVLTHLILNDMLKVYFFNFFIYLLLIFFSLLFYFIVKRRN